LPNKEACSMCRVGKNKCLCLYDRKTGRKLKFFSDETASLGTPVRPCLHAHMYVYIIE